KEAEFGAKFLGSKEPQTRITAAETLKAMNDPQATQLVDKYLTEEKAPWVIQKIKGQFAPTPLILKPVSSSEDQLNPAFIGTWKGFWITPLKGVASGAQNIASLRAIFRLQSNSANEFSGDLTILSKTKNQVWELKRIEGKASRLRGVLSERLLPTQPGQTTGVEAPFEADLTEEVESPLIRLRAPRIGASLIIRKAQ
ncbi:MAG: hypothetical protein AABZ55_15335, partial [Bdellovibrionota bacterium]